MAVRRTKRKRPSRWESDIDFDRRRSKRQGVKRVGFMMPSIGRGPLIKMQKVTMRYQTGVLLNPIANVTTAHVFSANGMYDPDITGVGHQPRGFDQLMALYDHYVVIGAKITVDFVPGSTEVVNAEVGVALRDSTIPDDSNGYIEGGNVMYSYMSGRAGYQTRIVYQVNPNKFLGRSKPLADPDCKGSSGGNPTEQAFFHCFATNAIGGEDLGGVCACVLIEYTAMLIEPKVPGQS